MISFSLSIQWYNKFFFCFFVRSFSIVVFQQMYVYSTKKITTATAITRTKNDNQPANQSLFRTISFSCHFESQTYRAHTHTHPNTYSFILIKYNHHHTCHHFIICAEFHWTCLVAFVLLYILLSRLLSKYSTFQKQKIENETHKNN